MKTIAYKTRDPQAIAWWHAHQERFAAAMELLGAFGAAVTPLIGPCEHGNDRHDIAYTTSHRDEISIVGVVAEPQDIKRTPTGFRIEDGVLKGNPGSTQGLRFIDLAEQHSSTRLLDGVDVTGIPSSLNVDGGVLMPGIGFDPQTVTLYQFWTSRTGVKKHVRSAIERSGIAWERATNEELAEARTRGASQ